MERGSGALADDDLFEVSIMKNEKKKKNPTKTQDHETDVFTKEREERRERREKEQHCAPPVSISL